jgi:hypothetical protein
MNYRDDIWTQLYGKGSYMGGNTSDWSAVKDLVVNDLIDVNYKDLEPKMNIVLFMYPYFTTTGINPVISVVNMIKMMIEHGADPNMIDNKGRTPLMSIVSLNEYPRVMWSTRDNLRSFRKRRLDNAIPVMNLLIKAGSNINAKSPRDGKTALMLAVMNGFDEAVEFLFESGADPTITDDRGNDADDYDQQGKYNLRSRFLKRASRKNYNENIQGMFGDNTFEEEEDDEDIWKYDRYQGRRWN